MGRDHGVGKGGVPLHVHESAPPAPAPRADAAPAPLFAARTAHPHAAAGTSRWPGTRPFRASTPPARQCRQPSRRTPPDRPRATPPPAPPAMPSAVRSANVATSFRGTQGSIVGVKTKAPRRQVAEGAPGTRFESVLVSARLDGRPLGCGSVPPPIARRKRHTVGGRSRDEGEARQSPACAAEPYQSRPNGVNDRPTV